MIKTISKTIHKGEQSVVYTEIASVRITNEVIKLRITIKRDSYPFQSYARIEILNKQSLSWNNLYSIPYPLMTTKHGIFYDKIVHESVFVEDRNLLADMAKKILS